MFGRKKETGRDREAGRAKVSGRNAEKTTGGEKNMETMKKDGQETCPCCDRHCPVDNLHCSKGRRHFGLSDDRDDAERQDRKPAHTGDTEMTEPERKPARTESTASGRTGQVRRMSPG